MTDHAGLDIRLELDTQPNAGASVAVNDREVLSMMDDNVGLCCWFAIDYQCCGHHGHGLGRGCICCPCTVSLWTCSGPRPMHCCVVMTMDEHV